MDLRAGGSIGENIRSDAGLEGFAPYGSERAQAIPSPISAIRNRLVPSSVVCVNWRCASHSQPISTISLKESSMGMSNDDHVAVEEGATIMRLGAAILGVRCA